MKNYYEILKIPTDATDSDIIKAYRKAALKVHPDKHPGEEEFWTEKFKELDLAYNTLIDKVKRKEYDETQLKYFEKSLHLAVETNDLEAIKILLAKGADVNKKNNTSNTALHYAAKNGFFDIVKLLINYNADVNLPNMVGYTALHYAAMKGHKTIVKLLLEKGVDINYKNTKGDTALTLAAKNGHIDVVNLLYETIEKEEMAKAIQLSLEQEEIKRKENQAKYLAKQKLTSNLLREIQKLEVEIDNKTKKYTEVDYKIIDSIKTFALVKEKILTLEEKKIKQQNYITKLNEKKINNNFNLLIKFMSLNFYDWNKIIEKKINENKIELEKINKENSKLQETYKIVKISLKTLTSEKTVIHEDLNKLFLKKDDLKNELNLVDWLNPPSTSEVKHNSPKM